MNTEKYNDWSQHTIAIRPLLVRIEDELNKGNIEQAEVFARKLKEQADNVLNYCARVGR